MANQGGITRDEEDAPTIYQGTHVVQTGKVVDFQILPANVFGWIDSQGWAEFLSVNELVYDELVKEFYLNLKLRKDEENLPFIDSKVKKHKIKLTTYELSDMLGIRDEGLEKYSRTKWVFDDTADIKNCLAFLTGKEVLDATLETRPSRDSLNINQQITLKLLRECIIPSGSHDKRVGILESSFLYLLANEVPINLPYVMLFHMKYCKYRKELPYGMILTKVFRNKKIPLKKYHGRDYPYKRMDEESLRHSGIYKMSDDRFIRADEYKALSDDQKNAYRRHVGLPDLKRKRSASTSSGQPSTSTQSQENPIIAYLKKMEERWNKKFKKILTKLSCMEDNYHTMKHEIQTIKRQVNRMDKGKEKVISSSSGSSPKDDEDNSVSGEAEYFDEDSVEISI